MSVQVAKSGSGTNPPGRRIPMSLSGSTKSNKADTEKDSNTKETQSNNKTATKTDNTTDNKTKSDANKKTTENDANNKKPTSDNSNAKEKGNNDDKKKGNKSDRSQNGVNEVKNTSTTNGHKVDDSKKVTEEKNEKAEKKTTRAENLRQKEGKEKDEKKETKGQEKAEESSSSSNDKKTSNTNEEVKEVKEKPKEDKTKKDNDESKKSITIDEDVIEIEDDVIEVPQNPPETPKKSEKKTKENEISPNEKVTQEAAPKSIPSPTRIDSKPENEDEEEMESLIFEDNTDSHGPLETSTPGKILKLNYSPSLSEHKKLRKETFQAPIEYDQPKYSITSSSSVSSSSEKPTFSTSSYRSISGRRSLRPMKDYSFQSMYRESYRKINTELDYTTSSMNVTVGSEIPSESTFSFFGRGKKRERTPPASYSTVETQQADIDLSPKSPKRPRLDLSGLFGIVSSPITLLRARFTKTKIECSTPNGKLTSKDDNEEVENVSVITSEEVATDETTNMQDEEDVIIKDIETEEVNEIKEPIDVDLPENDNVAVDVKSEEAISSSTQTLNKKRMCSVM